VDGDLDSVYEGVCGADRDLEVITGFRYGCASWLELLGRGAVDVSLSNQAFDVCMEDDAVVQRGGCTCLR
jgi:hypothetical protein